MQAAIQEAISFNVWGSVYTSPPPINLDT